MGRTTIGRSVRIATREGRDVLDAGAACEMCAALEQARTLLAVAADDFERISARSRSDAIRAACGVLAYRDIEIAVAEVLMAAERRIAFANPGIPAGELRKDVASEEQVIGHPV